MRIASIAVLALVSASSFAAPVPPAHAQDAEVDLELVLAVDVSRSMDLEEHELQRQGYIDGIQHPEVVGAIRSGLMGRIAVTYVEWAGPGQHAVIVPWSVIDGAESAAAFADRLSGTAVMRLRGTSISSGLMFAGGLFDGNGFQGTRQVIDISGDGPNNAGAPVLPIREAVLARGVTINGLPIMLKTSYDGTFGLRQLDIYYEDCVIGGPGAFLVTVSSMDNIAQAIRRKLVLEIAGQPIRAIPAGIQQAQAAPRVDCMIGEKMRRRWMRDYP